VNGARREYQEILINSIAFCQQHKELKIYCYCILPSHIHFITYSESNSLTNILRDFKAYTAKQLMNAIAENHRKVGKNGPALALSYG
jgi:putative transposase